jgi:hypothetical protein
MTLDLLVTAAVRMSAILAIALVLARAASRASASTRHWVLATAVCGALAMPVLTALLPRWHVPVGTPHTVQTRPAQSTQPADVSAGSQFSFGSPALAAASPAADTEPAPSGAVRLLSVLWLSGIVCAAIALAA